ncbi:MAG: excinuclease ABC subunit UvrB [Candidatus Sumerlaeia bacterium]|nr:excinuclease ABC subunit UvrB [Candidatus Sumerlaeia bacterium]
MSPIPSPTSPHRAQHPREARPFRLVSEYTPQGDQPQAIERLVKGLERGLRDQVLLGVTGSGKTFTMANVIAQAGRPALVLAPNKILAAQLYREFKELFPENAVEYFVSYYDYYMPEAYIPSTDTYIEKDSSINEELDKLRLSATNSVLDRRDVIIVASVSCIYGIGDPSTYTDMRIYLEEGLRITRDALLRRLVDILYARNDLDFHRGTFRVRGDVVDVYPAYAGKEALRIEFFGDEIESLSEIDALRGTKLRQFKRAAIYPASHYVTNRDRMEAATEAILAELEERVQEYHRLGRPLEAQRIEQRTRFDVEMMIETGTCAGIENYSRHLTGREAGEPPPVLLDYFPEDFLLFVDESHVTLPQVRAMYRGDRARKETLVEHGFRLPSALDNRPLRSDEFEARLCQAIHVSATPAEDELQRAGGVVVEQLVRPTGLIDPRIEVRPASTQVDDLIEEIRATAGQGHRVLVTTLTKRMAEDLTEHLSDLGIRVKYMHSDINAIERTVLIRGLRNGDFDVLVGINLLREGLDLPEVALVAILDADKEGYLRSATALIQTCGRAARNIDGRVIMYADRVTDSMRRTIDETERRRARQEEYNTAHGITPQSVRKSIRSILDTVYEKDHVTGPRAAEAGDDAAWLGPEEIAARIQKMKREMRAAAEKLEFERAAELRDKMLDLERRLVEQPLPEGGPTEQEHSPRPRRPHQ